MHIIIFVYYKIVTHRRNNVCRPVKMLQVVLNLQYLLMDPNARSNSKVKSKMVRARFNLKSIRARRGGSCIVKLK